MGVIYIGDRAVGKTHLAMELANPNGNFVKVVSPDYKYLKNLLLYDENTGKVPQTLGDKPIYDEYLEIQAELPIGNKQINVDWLDTPGEIWRQKWQSDHRSQWQQFLDTITKSEGILLIIPPYRELIKSPEVDPDKFITRQQWCKRFNRWVNFFSQDCPKIRHLLICLNKADLFCSLKQEASKLAYIPHHSQMNWQQRDRYVFQKYFRPVHSQINLLNRSIDGLSVRCFITSIYDRYLLELPWIYLASFLAE